LSDQVVARPEDPQSFPQQWSDRTGRHSASSYVQNKNVIPETFGYGCSGRKHVRAADFAAFDDQAQALIEMTHVNDFLGTYNTIQDAEAAVFV